jgi:exodeoxyribonuclease VII small subunit
MAKKKADGTEGDATGDLSFEASLERVEEIVGQLEGGQLGLSASLARYEEGVKYLKFCFQQLERAERKIELLSGVDAEGRPIVQPFAESEMTLEEKQAARSRRRSRNGGASEASDEIDDRNSLF